MERRPRVDSRPRQQVCLCEQNHNFAWESIRIRQNAIEFRFDRKQNLRLSDWWKWLERENRECFILHWNFGLQLEFLNLPESDSKHEDLGLAVAHLRVQI
jgi:hypothetical protein